MNLAADHAHNYELPELWRLLNSYEGKQPLSYMRPELLATLDDRLRQVVVNWARLVVDALEERIDLTSFRLGGKPEADKQRAYGIVGANPVMADRNPRAELERRLATRRADRWGMPALAAAAAVVVAAVITPMVVFQDDGGGMGRDRPAAAAQTEPGASDVLDPPILPSGAIPLGTFSKDGRSWQAVAYHEEKQVCVQAVVADGSETTERECTPVPDWPREPVDSLVQAGVPVLSEEQPDTGPLPHLLMFVTAPQVATLDVRNGPGEPVTVTKLGVTETATLWLADFGGSTQDFGWDAKDAAGNYIDGGIT